MGKRLFDADKEAQEKRISSRLKKVLDQSATREKLLEDMEDSDRDKHFKKPPYE